VTTLGLLSALLLKPAALVAVALGTAAIMRRTGAGPRHTVWLAAIGGMLALPLLAAALPDLRVPRLDDGLRRVSAAAKKPGVAREPLSGRPSDSLAPPAEPSAAPTRIDHDGPHRVVEAAFLLWAVVACLLLARRIGAELHAHRIARSARPAPERLSHLGARIARASDLTAAELRVSDLVASPVVVGLVRPIVLLPNATMTWADADLEPMLAHELGHVGRRDCLANFCADVAASVYWCNPLVRLAANRLRLEAERACDERVVRSGANPRAYAELLLRVARTGKGAPSLTCAATAMSRARELESRLVALLDGQQAARPVSRGMAVTLVALGVAVTLPAAALTVSAAEPPVVTAGSPTQQGMAPEPPGRLGDSLASPSSERVPLRIDADELDRRVAAASSGVDSIFARSLLGALRHTPTHEADLVRERARWVFSRTTNGRLIEPLLESLGESDWRVQAYAAWALGVAGDARAIPPLVPLLRSPVWRLRAMAAFALRTSSDPRALDAMRAALTDPAWQVRVEAVEYVAVVGGAGERDLIRARLDDRHVAVRLAAESALGIH